MHTESSQKNRKSVYHAPTNSEALKNKTTDINHELLKLHRKIRTLESIVAELKVDQNTTYIESIDENNDQASIEEVIKREEEEALARINSQIDMFNDSLQSEQIDAKLSNSAIIAIYEMAQKQENNTKILEILKADCRSSFCRIELLFDVTFPEESFRELQDFMPWNGQKFLYINDIDSGKAVMYMAREGRSLPQP